ncbi:MAG: hypothetical protein V1871_03470 [Planctomycetota bacterium]
MKNRAYYIVVAILSFLVMFVIVFNYGSYSGRLGVGGFNENSGRIFSIATNPATNITSNSAKLNGTVNPNGIDTFVYFQYGTTMTYGTFSDKYQFIGSGMSPVNVFADDLTGLSPNTLYNFRVVVNDYNGTTYGNNLKFATGN